ncbi:MAG TPA: CPBP family intramembrane glutamic endopeptidase [Candidatus Eisenbacteria bacterium]|jgi:membrane protease YdiL (CAAX protease family)
MDWARRHPIGAFFLLSLLLSWAGWLPYGAYRAGLLPFTVAAEVPMFSQYGPLVAALILSGALRGPDGPRDLLRRMVRWRVSPAWYLYALLVAPAAGCLIWAIHSLIGWSHPDFSKLHEWWIARAEVMRYGGHNVVHPVPEPSFGLLAWLTDVTSRGPLGATLVWIAMAVGNGGISEEPGWRGFAQPQLETRMAALSAALATGLLWGLWHFGPDSWMLLLQGNPSAFALPLGTAWGTIPLAVLFAVLYNHTGSVLLCILFHASVNTTYNIGYLIWQPVPFYLRYMEYGLIYWVLAGAAVALFGATRLHRGEPRG